MAMFPGIVSLYTPKSEKLELKGVSVGAGELLRIFICHGVFPI
jgi:hypothetical protein